MAKNKKRSQQASYLRRHDDVLKIEVPEMYVDTNNSKEVLVTLSSFVIMTTNPERVTSTAACFFVLFGADS